MSHLHSWSGTPGPTRRPAGWNWSAPGVVGPARAARGRAAPWPALASAVLAALIAAALTALGLPAAGSRRARPGHRRGRPGRSPPSPRSPRRSRDSARGRAGIAIGVLGAAYLLRAIGDSAGTAGARWLSWLSPLGWIECTRPVRRESVVGAGAAAGSWRRWPSVPRTRWPPAATTAPACCPTGPGRPRRRRLLREPVRRWPGGCSAVRWSAGWPAAGRSAVRPPGPRPRASAPCSATRSSSTYLRPLGGQAGLINAYLAALMSMPVSPRRATGWRPCCGSHRGDRRPR